MRARGPVVLGVAAVLALAGCGDGGGSAPPDPSTSTAAPTAAAADIEDVVVRVHLVRHGETVQNAKGILAGWADAPLTPDGVEVAAQAGEGLADTAFVAAWSSDLQRTQETARGILAAHPDAPDLQLDPGLREWWFGGFEGDLAADVFDPLLEPVGLTGDDLYRDMPGSLARLGDGRVGALADLVAAGDESGLAETGDEIEARVSAALDRVVADAAAQGGGDVLVVTHGLAILSMLDVVGDEEVERTAPGNVSRTTLTWQDGVWTVDGFDDTGHLVS
ncbi:histidine phosphatase family protein [Cellulomonas triticagri]|uniref:Histidine phosphatase family protein n=1 Tax=Cellulomonas triticagri TaxID=2483352 RepID=A0A3M2JFG1_9CELL|nr:histidine phosphatase family protein [Cellulomonas triticagri]RMI09038.1 histidine phosphatase family protein [Cellulomonas triticagri]